VTARVILENLVAAMSWVSSGEDTGIECAAYINRISGEVHWVGDGVDEEPPDDLDDESIYVEVPTMRDLDLGRSLALSFAKTHLPQFHDEVRGYFGKRGAYSRFKALLERTDHLDAWHQHEQTAIDEQLRQWCEENDLEVVPAKNGS